MFYLVVFIILSFGTNKGGIANACHRQVDDACNEYLSFQNSLELIDFLFGELGGLCNSCNRKSLGFEQACSLP